MPWNVHLADYSQRAISVLLLGLTIYGLSLLTKGGHRAWTRYKNKKLEDGRSDKGSDGREDTK